MQDKSDLGVERRKFVRADYACRIKVFSPVEHELNAHTSNLGAGGVRVILDEKLQDLSVVGLKLYLTAEPLDCRGRIIWALGSDDAYDTGIEFYAMEEKDRLFVVEFVDRLARRNTKE